MKKLSIRELFSGYEKVDFPSDIDINTRTVAMPYSMDADEGALLFLSDKVGEEPRVTDASGLKNHPVAIVTSKTKEIHSAPCPTIRADDPRAALAYALSNQYEIDYHKTKFIGVTGSSGKTTTATLIYEILTRCGYKVGFIGTGRIISGGELLSDANYSMTTPDPTLLYPSVKRMETDACRYIVMEVSSHSIALGKVAPIPFEYSVFTNLDDEHLDFHKTKEEYFKTKLSLFSQSKRGLFNLDDEYSRRAAESATCEVSTYGIINQGDAYATQINLKSLTDTSFYYRANGLIFNAQAKLGGAFNVYNSLAALKCVIDLGIKPCIAKRALAEVSGIDGRMEIIESDIRVVIDYAHTPMAFYNCLKTLKSRNNTKQKLIVVFGCGGDRDRLKRPLFGKYAEEIADKIIITEDNSRGEPFSDIAKDITRDIDNFTVIEDRESAIRYAVKSAKAGDIVAVIGKGHERYKIVGGEYLPFDERAIILDAIKERGIIYARRD